MTEHSYVEARRFLDTAIAEFQRGVDAISEADWQRPTPCDGWTVRDLVAHLIGGCRMSELLLSGATSDEAMTALFALQIDGDPKQRFAEGALAQAAAFDEPGAPERTCHHPMRDMPGSEFIWLRVRDTAVHAWDLATALGIDATLDPEMVELMWTQVEPAAPFLAASGMFGSGASGNLPPEATTQQRLLDTLGRRA
ncbi:MAG: TIGR03086 family metal-binding protein [Acidimicrobiia bacterium]